MKLFNIFKKKENKNIDVKNNNDKSNEETQIKNVYDDVFGDLVYYDDYGFEGNIKVNFFGKDYEAKLTIRSEENQIKQMQYDTYNNFIDNLDTIQIDVAEQILNYYNNGEKYAYGPDDEEEKNLWWPGIDTIEDVVKNIHLDTIIIPEEVLMTDTFKGRTIFMLFDRDWGGEDLEDNGVCAKIVNEKVEEIAYKDLAY